MSDIKITTDDKAQIRSLASRGDLFAKALVDAGDSRIVTGLMVGAPTTPSAQVTGTGNTTWNVNIDKGLALAEKTLGELAAQADVAVHSGSKLLDNGQSCKATIVVKKAADGTFSTVAVKGTAATTGSEAAPSDADIQTAVGAGLSWVKLAEVTLNRTGDTTVTQSYDNTKRNFGLVL